VGCIVYQRQCPSGFQETYQKLSFHADLGENIGRYDSSALAIRIGEFQVLQPDHPPLEQESFRSG
jgi:hypothetical protein